MIQKSVYVVKVYMEKLLKEDFLCGKVYKEISEQTLSTCTPNKFDGGAACVKK